MDWVAGFTWIEWQPSLGLGGRHPWNMQHEGRESVRGATFNQDAKPYSQLGTWGEVRLWRARDGTPIAVMQHEGRECPGRASAKMRAVFSAGEVGTIRLWRARDGTPIAVMQHEGTGVSWGRASARCEPYSQLGK